MARLTKRTADAFKPLKHKDVFAWDSEIRGLGIRLKPSRTNTFFIQYRNETKRTRRLVLGQFGVLTVEQARILAREQLTAVLRGQDLLPIEKLCKAHLRFKSNANGTLAKQSRVVFLEDGEMP